MTIFKLDIDSQLKAILAKFSSNELIVDKSINNDILNGIHDGRLFERISKNNQIDGFCDNNTLTFTINTDGISLYNKSNITIWPVYLVLNELPVGKRFLIDNVILAGLSIGEEKPHFDLLMKPIVTQLIRYQYGLNIKFKDVQKNMKLFLIAGIYDKPARYAVINMVQYNGAYGCTKCLQSGESLKTDSGGTTRVYPLNQEDPAGPKRTDDDYQTHLEMATAEKDPVFGIKGACLLSYLKHYKPVSSTCIDYMHSLLEGVIKRLFHHSKETLSEKEKIIKEQATEIHNLKANLAKQSTNSCPFSLSK